MLHSLSAGKSWQILIKKEVITGESRNGNPTSIWVGTTMAGRLLEIGVEYLEDMDWIYHANSVSSHYRKLYENKNIYG
jgi:hypothetical protein